jgi:hypothetical protein
VGASDFSGIVSKFRELFIVEGSEYGAWLDLIFVGEWLAHCPDEKLPWSHGFITVSANDTFHLARLCGIWNPDESRESFLGTAALAGASLPNRIRDGIPNSVRACLPDTAFAWWVAVMWVYSTIRPRWRLKDETFGGPDDSPVIGLRWDDPILASLSAIEEAGLLGPDPAKATAAQGEWSRPMSRAEMARRLIPNKSPRARAVNRLLAKAEKQRISKNLWSIRLDTLPASMREKLQD